MICDIILRFESLEGMIAKNIKGILFYANSIVEIFVLITLFINIIPYVTCYVI